MKKKKKDKRKLYKELDTLFQKRRVLENTDSEGYGNCCSCGKNLFYKSRDAQGGHFIPKSVTRYNYLRWHSDNCHLQCGQCNNYKSGNVVEYRKFMIDKYGLKRVEELESEYTIICKWTREEIEGMIAKEKRKIKELESDKF